MSIGRLHVITDARPGRNPMVPVLAALEAGAPVVQVRAKRLTDRELYELACRIAERCAAHGALCLVNDRVDVARAVGAAGAHVGDDDLPVAAARTALGPGLVLGATARGPQAARAHEAAGADYVGVGPAFRTTTKDGLPAPIGASGVGAVASAIGLPVIAVGAVTAAQVPELLGAGAYGVAVVSAVSEADDPHAATEELLRAIERASAS